GKSRDITTILIQWMSELKNRQLVNFPFILMDKDFIASNKPISNYSYDPIVAYQECSAIDPYWKRSNNHIMFVFCPSNLKKQVIDLVELHYNRHILLPKSNGEYYMSSQAIWEDCVKEM
ncbi:10106_t:CDS:2, partial [Scutellospora calospora]